jgi:hypothetical protein
MPQGWQTRLPLADGDVAHAASCGLLDEGAEVGRRVLAAQSEQLR